MMHQDEIKKLLEKEFQVMKKELGFKSSFEQVDEIFFIEDGVLKDGFVSSALSRQISGRISELYGSWANYIHNLLFPVPGHMIFGSEAKSLNEEDRKVAWNIMRSCMEIASRNSRIGINKEKNEEGKFLDDAVNFWNTEFKPKMGLIIAKINQDWAKK